MKKLLPALLLCVAAAFASSEARAFTVQIDQAGNTILPWVTNEITFDVNYTDCLALGVTSGQLDSLIDQAFALWNSTPDTDLKLSRGAQVTTTVAQIQAQTSSANPLIICDASLSTHISGSTTDIPAVTQLLRVDSSRHIALAMVYLNADGTQPANVKNVLKFNNLLPIVLAHEVGHAVGLGHSSDTSALMYYDASSRTQLSLSQDDMNGITYLYPRHELSNSKIFGCGTLGAAGGGGRAAAGRGGDISDSATGAGFAQFVGLLSFCALVTLWARRSLAS